MGANDRVEGSRPPEGGRPASRPPVHERGGRSTVPGPARDAATLLAGVLDALPDAVLVADEEGHILWVNREFERLLGISPRALHGRRVSLLAGPYEEQAEGAHVLALVRRGEGELEVPAFQASGESFPCLVRVRPLADLGGRPARIVTVTDQTESQRLRAELVARAEAIQREKEILRATAACLDREGLVVADEGERVILVNVRRPVRWEDLVNERLAEGAARWPNAEVLDWHTLALAHPEWFVDDRTHLRYYGAESYVGFIMRRALPLVAEVTGVALPTPAP